LAGIRVVAVDCILASNACCASEADVTFEWDGMFLDIECKRPRSYSALVERAKEARRQIQRPSRCGRHGIIAVDCSVLIRPEEHLFESDAVDEAERLISIELERSISPKVTSYLTNSILGFVFFARVPTMTRVRRSQILTAEGKPIDEFRRDCITTWLVVANTSYCSHILQCLASRLHKVA
jgi:hypothetical protein